MRKAILSILFIFFMLNLNAQDTSKVKIIYPSGQVIDTSYVEAVVATLGEVLTCRKYTIITYYFTFPKESSKQNEPYKQEVLDDKGKAIINFKERLLWAKQIEK